MGSGILSNITITSSDGAVVMCNNTGTVFCDMCSNVTIESITWDKCGNPMNPCRAGIEFAAVANISIKNCTFQNSEVCRSVNITQTEAPSNVSVTNSIFMFNTIRSELQYSSYRYLNCSGFFVQCGSLSIDYDYYSDDYYSNGQHLILIKNTSFISNGIKGVFIWDTASISKIVFDNVDSSNNSYGIYVSHGSDNGLVKITSSHFTRNHNGALYFENFNDNLNLDLYNTTFANNSCCYDEVTDNHGTALHILTYNNGSTINMSSCNFIDNIGGNSMVCFTTDSESIFINVLITSSNFIGNKIGSALQIKRCFLCFSSSILFQNNSARSGAAIYIAERSQITIDDGSIVKFVNNTAFHHGGAMYVDLTNCYDHGIVFTNITNYNTTSFINNSAKLSGNSMYFNIPKTCNVVRDRTKNNSAAYIPYKFHYNNQLDDIDPVIFTSQYEIKLCSPDEHDFTNATNSYNTCVIEDDKMLGEIVYFDAVVYDYFNTVAKATYLQLNCSNCGNEYKLLHSNILIQNGLTNKISILSVNASDDLKTDTNITIDIFSVLSPLYKQLTATLSLTLSSCNNGYLFNDKTQRCECYDKNGYLQCVEDSASIKLGYWFGVFKGKQTLSLCNKNYCNFTSHRNETRNEFYNLPEELDDQCNSHRTGVACGECKQGYTLAYDTPDCISVNKCSPVMIVLITVLTITYWVTVIIILFGLSYYLNTQAKISIGYLYGIIYFYSTVDILLFTNLYVIDGVFYMVTILSSFAKLTPQFLGRVCFIKNLDAIDQQFIHYCHVVFISLILIGIVISVRRFKRITFYVDHCIAQVTSLILLLSYSSLTSASLLLLRAFKFDDVDGLYTYLSPHLKYFANRHAVYASVAILCGLLVTVGLPLLLVLEPIMTKIFEKTSNKNIWDRNELCIEKVMAKNICFAKMRLILDQLQGCYKDKYRWFAAYYLICRLVIMLITYFANDDYENTIYYLQTACVIIAMIHIWIQPYKNDMLNVIDTVILLVMLLIVNISAFNLSTSATAGIAISLIIAPLFLLFGVGIRWLMISKVKKLESNLDSRYAFGDNFDLKSISR